MSLIIAAQKLDGVLFPGDTFRCTIEFKNTKEVKENEMELRQHLEVLAWASAQIHGQYVVDPSMIFLDASTQLKFLASSHLPKLEHGRIMYTSTPEIIVCDLKLKPQESKKYSLPPTYTGTCIKYSNWLTIQTQQSASTHASPPQDLRIPFRVLNPGSGLRKNIFKPGCPGYKSITTIKELDVSDPTPLEPFRLNRKEKPIKDKETRKILKLVFERFGKPLCININKGSSHIAVFTLERSVFEPGDVVRGYIDFTNSAVPCYYLTMKMEIVEEVPSEVFSKTPGKPSVISKVIAESEEALHNTRATNFEFYIPMKAAPTFSTELITVRWMLRFELTAAATPTTQVDPHAQTETAAVPEHKPATPQTLRDISTEKMNWSVPVKVMVTSYPTDLLEDQQQAPKEWKIEY